MSISLQGASFSYGDKEVLKEISLEVEDGNFFALIGPNGSGKSTLLKLMSGLLRPSHGRVDFDGRPVSDYSPRQLSRRLAVIPSEHHFDFPFLVKDVVAMGRFPYLAPLEGLRSLDRDLVRQALEQTRTEALQDRPISQLSSGERQRVLIARALAQQPGTLILDEPNAHLDINHQISIFRLLAQLNRRERKTIVVVLHDLTMVGAFCKRVALIHQGLILQQGTPAQIIQEETIRRIFGADVDVMTGPHGNPVLSYSLLPNDEPR